MENRIRKFFLLPVILLALSPIILTGGLVDGEMDKPVKNRDFAIEKPNTVKAIYLTANTIASANLPNIIQQLIDSGGNAVVMDIEISGGRLSFPPKNEYLKSINEGSRLLDNLTEIVNYLHHKGIYTIARQVVFNDPYTAARKPEWRIAYKGGGLFDANWLDPSKAGVQYYNLMIMKEVAEFGFDEIQFDYIRFPASNHGVLDYHYDEAKFNRWDVINEYLKKARIIADEYDIKMGVDVFGATIWGNVDWKDVGQSIPDIAKIVDVIYPMTYPSHVSPGYYGFNNPYGAPYPFVHDSIAEFMLAANGQAEIRPYIQGFPLRIPNFGEWFVAEQIQAALDAGATGYAIWSPGNNYNASWSSMPLEPALEAAVIQE